MALARSPNLQNLTTLELSDNPIGAAGAQALASWAQARFASGGAPLLEDAMDESTEDVRIVLTPKEPVQTMTIQNMTTISMQSMMIMRLEKMRMKKMTMTII